MDLESIRRIHTERSTKYTLELYEKIKAHTGALDADDAQKVELLTTEVSILQALLNYVDITTIIFASQFELFDTHMYPYNELSQTEIEAYFSDIKARFPDVFGDWDCDRYLAYPLTNNLIQKQNDEYRLTDLGTSYVMNVRNNPDHKKYMTQL